MLIDQGANVDHTANNHRTALMLAVKEGHTDIVRMLIEAGLPYEARRAKCGADVNHSF